jgi:RND superfamily putative drug exporter
MAPVLVRLADFVSRRRKAILLVWLAALAGSVYFAAHQQDRLLAGGWGIQGSESLRGSRMLEDFDAYTSPALGVLVTGPASAVARRLATARSVAARDPRLRLGPLQPLPDGTGAIQPLSYRASEDEAIDIAGDLRDALEQTTGPTKTYVIGQNALWAAYRQVAKEELEKGEALGFPLIFLILLAGFGTVVAALAPLALGFVAVVITGALVFWISHVYTMSIYVTNIASMIGIGVAVDYSLFIVSRFRTELQEGRTNLEALRTTLATSGNAVFFSGATVAVSLAGLFLIPMKTMRSMALGAIVVVCVAVIASLTLLAALIITLGPRLERFRLRLPWKTGSEAGGTFWKTWTTRVLNRPILFLVFGVTVMVTLALPLFSISNYNRGLAQLPRDNPVAVASLQARRALGPGSGGPVHVLATDRAASNEMRARLARTRGVVGLGPTVASRGGKAYVFDAVLSSDPEQEQARQTFGRIRAVRDTVEAERDGDVVLSGVTALSFDVRNSVIGGLWKLIVFIVAVSYIVLLLLLRSVLLPLKAVFMNVLSVGAAYGVLVAVFQWGWLDWTGYDSPGYIDTIVPALVLAVTFGLSMDYEVFLLTRIRERWQQHGSNDLAVAEGVQSSARIITSAAIIMVAVFCSFAIAGSPQLKELGIGLAVAVGLDATLIRLVVVPATMRLLGNWNWWLPGRLERVLPQFGEATP